MTTVAAAAGGDFFRCLGVLAQACTSLRAQNRPRLHRNSHQLGTCEATFWRSTTRQEIQKILKAAQRYELHGRKPGRRNGPLGSVALEVLALFGNLVSFKTGRLDPSLDWIMDKLKRSRDAVVRALKALRDHGFLDWLRRFEPTPNDGRGPQVRQVSNAYRLFAPKHALALLGRWSGRPSLPGDDAAARADRKAIEAEHVASLDLGAFASFQCGDSPLGRALAQMGKALDLRESVKRTESQSTSYSYVQM
ncbi:helix-turn-helix domain-containing protein [Paracoccus shandongensis]|uniref:helix-turn-helix domain-containing protein n=1 Tax=Paracoccus shandongensis TaxID=2816048 RepID=UPI001A8C073E|nr:helix-turn-helix domain-containing protein [Paracoccus shandongensis]